MRYIKTWTKTAIATMGLRQIKGFSCNLYKNDIQIDTKVVLNIFKKIYRHMQLMRL